MGAVDPVAQLSSEGIAVDSKDCPFLKDSQLENALQFRLHEARTSVTDVLNFRSVCGYLIPQSASDYRELLELVWWLYDRAWPNELLYLYILLLEFRDSLRVREVPTEHQIHEAQFLALSEDNLITDVLDLLQ